MKINQEIHNILKENSANIVAYIRIAKKETTGYEIVRQKEVLKQFCKKYNVEIRKYFIDNGFSGLNFNRPSYKEMMKDKQNVIILVYDFARITRNCLELQEVVRKHKEKIFISILGDLSLRYEK